MARIGRVFPVHPIIKRALSSTGITYTITPTGGITFAGSPLQIKTNIIEPSGSITFAGSPLQIKTKFQIPAGGITFGGTAPLGFSNGSTTFTITPTGGITFGGAPVLAHGFTTIPNGGIVFGGSPIQIKTKITATSGGVTFGGTGSMQFIPFGTILNTTRLPLTGSGT
jgi:hypothetical protein